MTSSGGGGGSSSYAQAVGAATPMEGIPIAGQGTTAADPTDYGRYQSFLPAAGSGKSATGLTSDMMTFRTPSQIRGGDMSSGPTEAENLRNQLAKALADVAAAKKTQAAPAQEPWKPNFGYEGVGTM